MAWPHDTYIQRMSDAELDAAIAAALDAAHLPDEAPFNEFNLHADGTKEIRNPSGGWRKASAEWVRLHEERDRRARSLPSPCTCCGKPSGDLRPFDGGMVCADCDPARGDGENLT